MEGRAEVYQPAYVADFVCDGAACRARCCRGWQIAINDAAYALYDGLEEELKREVLSSIRSFPPNAAFPKGGREIILQSDGSCPMIDPTDQLCKIQRACGEAYLSVACQVFPRMSHSLGGAQFRTMSLACPVAADAALTAAGMRHVEGARLREGERVWSALFQAEGWGTPYPRKEGDSDRRMMTVVLAMLAISRSDALSLVERLALLAYLADDVDECETEDADDEAIEDRIMPYLEIEDARARIQDVLHGLPFDAVGYARLWKDVFRLLQGTEDALEIIRPILERIDQAYRLDFDAEDRGVEGLAVRMMEVRHAYAEGMQRRHGELLRCYQLHELQYFGFPYQFDGSKLENICLHILLFGFFELCLYGLTACCGRLLTRHEAVAFVSILSRAVDHSIPFRNALADFIREECKRPEAFLQKILARA